MKIRIGNELLPLNLLVLVLVIAILFFPSNVARIILGIPFVLFFNGYTLVAALFPRKESMDNVQRVALSFGMSIAVVPLLGLILNYMPWGITLESTLYSVAAFIVIMSAVAWFRRRRFSLEERFKVEFDLRLPGWSGSAFNKALSVALVFSILGTLATAGYVLVKPRIGERFTEFYMLGPEGKAADFPEKIILGQPVEITIGIIQQERRTVNYRVIITLNDLRIVEVGPIALSHDQKWEEAVSFAPERVGENQKVEFLLYMNEELSPHLEPLRLWIDVIE